MALARESLSPLPGGYGDEITYSDQSLPRDSDDDSICIFYKLIFENLTVLSLSESRLSLFPVSSPHQNPYSTTLAILIPPRLFALAVNQASIVFSLVYITLLFL